MFLTAYAVARFLWLPLLACWAAAKRAPGRGAMWLPIAVAVAATIWEAMIPSSVNIRIDIFLVGPALMLAEGSAGVFLALSYLDARRRRLASTALGAAAALCIAACGFFILAWLVSTNQADAQYREHEEGSRRYFEVAFRDGDTQRASFGSLEGTRWAGYYVGEPPHPNYGHLVVNSRGDYFLYSTSFYERRGRLQPAPGDAALLAGKRVYLGNSTNDVELRDLGGGRVQFREHEGYVQEWTFVRKPPPRFPRPASPADKVHFKGVFSGVYDNSSPKWVGLAQLWLWESEGRWWAVWLRGTRSREYQQPVFANARVDVTCIDKACESLELRLENSGRERLKWQSADELIWNESGSRRVTLKRGEIMPGLPYAWAPLTNRDETRQWLRSLHPDITWQAPARE